MPPGVREVILARMEQLVEVDKSLLLAAAVLGRECTFERLCQVANASESEALLALRTKGLLERTLVVAMGEFGRTPKINANVGNSAVTSSVRNNSPPTKLR